MADETRRSRRLRNKKNPPKPPESMAKIPSGEVSAAGEERGDQVQIKRERISPEASPVPSNGEEGSEVGVPGPSSGPPSTSEAGSSRPDPCPTLGPSQAAVRKTAASQLRELLQRQPFKKFRKPILPGDLTPPSTPGSEHFLMFLLIERAVYALRSYFHAFDEFSKFY
ncbi:hypothetical protein QAD02_023313 [Eretmocerus hayati]|uniref:Uncharacterized protein n=1 Tax=Eretmocerus hayati TaxID=131215 RepID=A0ACC2PV89_9HYME|nr:hypothetical protein QAD02_023313 [Eretmocerus hayati]